MSKKVALLVTTTVMTRVVVEVPDDFDDKTDKELWYEESGITQDLSFEIARKATDQTIDNLNMDGAYLFIDEVHNDLECPADEWDD